MRTVFIERLKIPAKWLWIIEIEEKKTDQKNVRCFSSLSLEDHFSHGILMKRIKNRKIMKIKKKLVIDYLLSWLQWHGWLWELNVVNKVWRNNERYLQVFAKVIWKNTTQKCKNAQIVFLQTFKGHTFITPAKFCQFQ